MPSIARAGLLLAVLGATALVTAAPRQATAPQTGDTRLPETSFILGQVVDASSKQGVSGALVTLTGGTPAIPAGGRARGPAPRQVMTSADGRFLFRGLTRGTYTATVTLSGYMPGLFGRETPEGPPEVIVLTDHQRLTGVTIQLWKHAAISGTVRDELGEPMVATPVRVFRRAFVGGRTRFTGGPTVQTDDRGSYRISTLIPGDYVVSVPMITSTVPTTGAPGQVRGGDVLGGSRARVDADIPGGSSGLRVGDHTIIGDPRRSFAVHQRSPGGPLFVYPTLYYPGAATVTQATVITLASGEDRVGVDLAMRPVPATRVSGSLFSADGSVSHQSIRLLPAETDEFLTDVGMEVATSLSDLSGRFSLLGVPPGQYRLRVRRTIAGNDAALRAEAVARATASGSAARPVAVVTSSGDLRWADLAVSPGDAPLDNVDVTLRPGLRVSGRIEFSGTAPPPTPQQLQAISISLASLDARQTDAGGPARPDATGRFITGGYAPGRYSLNVTSPGPDWMIRSMSSGSANALAEPLILETDDVSNVVVRFSDRVTEISGTVQGTASPQPTSIVLLFPVDFQSWLASGALPRRQIATRPDANGQFRARVAVPGTYFIVAIPAREFEDLSPEFYAALSRVAATISIAEGERRTQTLTLQSRR